MTDLILKNVRPMGAPATDLNVTAGRFAESAAAGAETIDCGGRILIPGLVEAHTHLDKSLLGLPWYRNEVGPRLIDKIDNERAVKVSLGLDPRVQSERQALQSVAYGTTHIRSHVDVDTHHGLAGVEGVMATREKLAGIVDIEIVAFPQSGMITRPGTVELMDEALSMGVEVVGGLDPCGIDRDPRAHLDAIFGLAEKHGKPIDIHLHEQGALGWFSMEEILTRTRAHGMQGQVTVSHAFCLGAPDRAAVAALQEQLAEARIHIVTTAPASAPVPAVKELHALGILTGAGSDGIRDTWGPYGNGDMLERAMFVGLRNNLRRDDEVELALDICTAGGAAVMGLDGYGLAPGCHADAVLVEGETLAEAVALRAPRKLVLKGGRVTAQDGKCLTEAP
ncbi:amidohydrolase family protein [Jannaschia seohaensis]|uniref:Cytosine/adenosine deaminase n=1 Tax=Jannaschia seohaensis TaxID=475081 RepID=A0A2Y9C3E4_9RHOB|nr:amidohydrolase family protein [Jannaschia seohaensis]PWJ21632.1 cytosine/adenosine deaminase-related metal-dependent hydrolase [Jannaschia seohaensis]SSA37693.1 Cytosine/adenosine deaminase [Jannaschia seohaensis]